jgi:hypothetical protein
MHDCQGILGPNSDRTSTGMPDINESSDRIHNTEQCEESNAAE